MEISNPNLEFKMVEEEPEIKEVIIEVKKGLTTFQKFLGKLKRIDLIKLRNKLIKFGAGFISGVVPISLFIGAIVLINRELERRENEKNKSI
jgi:hypothetical protein